MRVDIEELRRLEREATPGPWEKCGGGKRHRCNLLWAGGRLVFPATHNPEDIEACESAPDYARMPIDLELVAAFRNAAPDLLSELSQARETIRRLRARHEVLRQLSITASMLMAATYYCLRCHSHWRRGTEERHRDGCLAAPEEEEQ